MQDVQPTHVPPTHVPKIMAAAAQNSWQPLIVCPDSEMARQIRSALSQLGFADTNCLPQYPSEGTVADILRETGCNICFVDISSNEALALLLIAESPAEVPVVALNPRNDPDLILRCLRRGTSEFLSEITVEQTRGVLARLAKRHTHLERRKPATVFALLPGKPGCGASTLAASLAIELKRGGVLKVLLVDADSLTGSIAFLLKLRPDFHLGDAIRSCDRMDDDLWARLVMPYHGVDVLPAPENPALPVDLDQQVALELMAFWREHYETIVLDLPGAHSGGCDLARISDEILLVTTNELAALHATRRSMEWLERSGVERSRLKLVVTRYTPAGLKRDDIETALKLKPYALLENDCAAVQNAALDGKPVAPGSHFGRGVHQLAQRLLGKEKAAPKRATFFGLLALKKLG
jgi:pilus assembly protein CpaE